MQTFREYLAEANKQSVVNKSDIGKMINDDAVLLYVGNDGGYRIFDTGNEVIQTYNKYHKLINEFVVYKKELDIVYKYMK